MRIEQAITKTLLAATCLLGLIAVAGAAYQAIGMRWDSHRSPEPGKLVDIGGYRLKINCAGAGSPTVILESGLGDSLSEWDRVQTGIAKFSRVCSYDRAGYGGSDAGPMPRTSVAIATELHMLLQRAGERPPFIMVGHSFGGYTVRVFNGKYPDDVAGLVLVDSPQEDEYQLLPPAWGRFSAALLERYKQQAKTAPFFVGLGIARFMLWTNGGLRDNDYLILQTKYLRARASELENIRTSAEQARTAGEVGDKPLVVLTAARGFEAPLPGFTQNEVVNSERTWVKTLQPRLARLSTRGTQLVLRDSGHDVPSDRPDAVVDAVHQISATLTSH